MPAFVIFVEGADTEPAKLPVYIVESAEHASLICEGMKESDYHIFDFSFKHCTRSDRGKFAVWATMIYDAREGVYGNIVGGIYRMIDGAYSIMSGRRSRQKIASGGDTETGNGGSTTAKQDDETASAIYLGDGKIRVGSDVVSVTNSARNTRVLERLLESPATYGELESLIPGSVPTTIIKNLEKVAGGKLKPFIQRRRDLANQTEAEPAALTGALDTAAIPVPKVYLRSWREIFACLGGNLQNTKEERARVARATKKFSGPIVLPKQGCQPFVEKNELLAWWNRLGEAVAEDDQRRTDKEATTAEQYNFGRGGTAAPGIGGGVKGRHHKRNITKRPKT